MEYQDFLVDKRIVQRNVEKGLVDPKVLERMIAQLPDRADNVAVTQVDEAGPRVEANDAPGERAGGG